MKQNNLLFRLVVLVTAMMCALGAIAQEAYACYTPLYKRLTFYYDNSRSSRSGITYDLNTGSEAPGWETDGYSTSVTMVVFNPSFADARPTTTYDWFCDMQNLEFIVGLRYLNTSEVTNMGWMFADCRIIKSLDLSGFNTSKVTNMRGMLTGCFDLTSFDLSSFDTSKVTDMSCMFSYCYLLQTVYVGSGWTTAAVTNSLEMFMECISLVGGQGSTYDSNHTDVAYARIDGGANSPGYFVAKSAFLRGDVDGDNDVTIADVSALIDYLLSGSW